MEEITNDDYRNFMRKNDKVVVADTEISIGKINRVNYLNPPDFELETTTCWSFPKRGNWATHYLNSKYRGNFAPQVPRNLILRYSKPDEIVLDPFVGSGTTLIECKLTGRMGIGVDINKDALILARDRLNFDSLNSSFVGQKTFLGDARNLNFLENESVDLIIAHPPYSNIIIYTKNSDNKSDLSKMTLPVFCEEIKKAIEEFHRVLKQGKVCAVLIGDIRKHKHQISLSFKLMKIFLDSGFVLKEHVIKEQHNTKTASMWKRISMENNFLLLAHENLFIFRKPEKNENSFKFKEINF